FPIGERRDIDAFRSAVNGMWSGVACPLGNIPRLDHLDDFRIRRIRLGIENMNARRPQTRHDEVAPLAMRMRRVRAEARGAGVPTEMMQLVADIGHRDGAEDS